MGRLQVSRMNGPIRCPANESKEVCIRAHLSKLLEEREVNNIVEGKKKKLHLTFQHLQWKLKDNEATA